MKIAGEKSEENLIEFQRVCHRESINSGVQTAIRFHHHHQNSTCWQNDEWNEKADNPDLISSIIDSIKINCRSVPFVNENVLRRNLLYQMPSFTCPFVGAARTELFSFFWSVRWTIPEDNRITAMNSSMGEERFRQTLARRKRRTSSDRKFLKKDFWSFVRSDKALHGVRLSRWWKNHKSLKHKWNNKSNATKLKIFWNRNLVSTRSEWIEMSWLGHFLLAFVMINKPTREHLEETPAKSASHFRFANKIDARLLNPKCMRLITDWTLFAMRPLASQIQLRCIECSSIDISMNFKWCRERKSLESEFRSFPLLII